MASSQEYLDFVLGQLSGLPDISSRAMMGEYILYYQGKVIGGIYDNRFLVKPTASAAALIPDAPQEIPYNGAKAMLLPDIDDRDLLHRLIPAIAADLPSAKVRKPKAVTRTEKE